MIKLCLPANTVKGYSCKPKPTLTMAKSSRTEAATCFGQPSVTSISTKEPFPWTTCCFLMTSGNFSFSPKQRIEYDKTTTKKLIQSQSNLLRPKVHLNAMKICFHKNRGEDKICSGRYDVLESNKCGSLTKTIMYLMQMQIAYCYIYIVHCVSVFPHPVTYFRWWIHVVRRWRVWSESLLCTIFYSLKL